jgi:hypothetical protein
MKPGSIVVCIDDTGWDEHVSKDFPFLPVKNRRYTVRRIIPHFIDPNIPDGVALEEIRGNWDFFKTYNGTIVYEEYHFRMNRFIEVEDSELIKEEELELAQIL